MMHLFIQKYGGTSLKDIPSRNNLVNNVKKCIEKGNHLVVVVSAIGREGDPYATDTLIKELEKINPTIEPKKKDLIMSCGEIISASIISHLLESQGIPCEALTGFQAGILTDTNFTSSEIINIDTRKILSFLKKGKVVVVAGFQGTTMTNEITTLGRGGSDTTAVTLGGYLKAERVDIFTDVKGVALIDPMVVPSTKYIDCISYDDMYGLAQNGVKVIHPRAVLAGKKFRIPIGIRSIHSQHPGTLITHIEAVKERGITGIALKEDQHTGIISILFKKDFINIIKKELEDLLFQDKSILKISWYDNKVSLIVEKSKIYFCANKLYHLLFQ
jgi:aspartate kinase